MPPKPRAGRSGSSYYDRGEERAKAFAVVLRRWRVEDGVQAPSERTLVGQISRLVGREYYKNDVSRTYKGESRLYHLTPDLVAAYVAATGHTDVEDVAEAFYAVKLLPPEVEEEDLKLAIASARGRRQQRGSQVA